MKTKTYQDLIFWQTAFEVSKLVIRLVAKLPKNPAVKIIISQLLRSSMSVGANISEGYRRFGPKEYKKIPSNFFRFKQNTGYYCFAKTLPGTQLK